MDWFAAAVSSYAANAGDAIPRDVFGVLSGVNHRRRKCTPSDRRVFQ